MSVARRIITEKILISITCIATIITSLILIFIIGKIAVEGLPALNWSYISLAEAQTKGYCDAIGNTLVGTILLSLLSVSFAVPIAVGTAIYLKKYASDNAFTRIVRFFIEVLSGMPSIILGVFGLLFLVIYLKYFTGGFSLLTGALALSVLILPVIERASEEAIGTVPKELEDGSYALGCTKWETIKNIIIPYSMSGIVTGIVLGIGRSAEESAVVVLTAGYSQLFPSVEVMKNSSMIFGIQVGPFQESVGVLAISVLNAFSFSTLVPRSHGFATALVLIIVVLLINLTARIIAWRWKSKTDTPQKGSGLSGIFEKIFARRKPAIKQGIPDGSRMETIEAEANK